jgi:hypothetical protein
MKKLFILFILFILSAPSLLNGDTPTHLNQKKITFGVNYSNSSSNSYFDKDGNSETDKIKYINLQSEGNNDFENVPLFYNYEFTKSTINFYFTYPISKNWSIGADIEYRSYTNEHKQKLVVSDIYGNQLTQEIPISDLEDDRFDYASFSSRYLILDSLHHLWLDFAYKQALGDYNRVMKADDIYQRRPIIIESKLSYGYNFGDNFVSSSAYYQYQDSYFRDLLGFKFHFESSKVENSKLNIDLDYRFPINGRLESIEYNSVKTGEVIGFSNQQNFRSLEFLPFRYNIQETSLNFGGSFDITIYQDYTLSIAYKRTIWGIDVIEDGSISFGFFYSFY